MLKTTNNEVFPRIKNTDHKLIEEKLIRKSNEQMGFRIKSQYLIILI